MRDTLVFFFSFFHGIFRFVQDLVQEHKFVRAGEQYVSLQSTRQTLPDTFLQLLSSEVLLRKTRRDSSILHSHAKGLCTQLNSIQFRASVRLSWRSWRASELGFSRVLGLRRTWRPALRYGSYLLMRPFFVYVVSCALLVRTHEYLLTRSKAQIVGLACDRCAHCAIPACALFFTLEGAYLDRLIRTSALCLCFFCASDSTKRNAHGGR